MYHIGVLRTLIQSNLYSSIPVISGTYGGSIAAAFCATNTEQELLSYVCVSNISTNYRERDDMKKLKIRWFPPMLEQAKNFISTGKLVEDDAYIAKRVILALVDRQWHQGKRTVDKCVIRCRENALDVSVAVDSLHVVIALITRLVPGQAVQHLPNDGVLNQRIGLL